MTLSLQDFLSSLVSNPMLILTVLLTLGVIFVNGWTDAPNAIATCVSTRSMGPRAAILMAAGCNFLGDVYKRQHRWWSASCPAGRSFPANSNRHYPLNFPSF